MPMSLSLESITSLGESMCLARKMFRVIGISFLMMTSPVAGAALPASVDGQILPSLAPMLDATTPSVVNISTKGAVTEEQHPLLRDPFFRRFFGFPQQRQRRAESLGSGVIVDSKNGFIITNHHVIEYATEINVKLHDGRSLSANLIGADPDTDIAVIKVQPRNLSALPLADSDKVRVGDFVVAIGNPFGLGQTVTSGIVSALGRSGLGIEDYEDFIQTDASINPGNSGGALVNLKGELVGINTAIIAPGGGNIGIGFAIPSNMAHDIMVQLVTHGRVRRGLLGVALQTLTPELSDAFNVEASGGAVIVKVKTGSPAAKSGMQPGDIIVSINDNPVISANDAHNQLGLLTVGEAVLIVIIRDGKAIPLSAQLAERASLTVDSAELHYRFAGAFLSDIDQSSPYFGHLNGVQVTEIKAGSIADKAGLLTGDLITGVNRIRTRDLQELEKVLTRITGHIVLRVQRGRDAVFVLIR